LHAAVPADLARYRGETRLQTESDPRVFLRWCANQNLDPLTAVRVDIEGICGRSSLSCRVTIRGMRRLVWGVLGLVIMAFVCVGVAKAAPAWERFRNPERFRGIDVLDSVHTPRSWLEAERAPDQDQYYPANSGQPPFKVPYKRWERRYLASDRRGADLDWDKPRAITFRFRTSMRAVTTTGGASICCPGV
jgi:hypothetical protein